MRRTSNELGVLSSHGVHDRGLLGTTIIGRVLSVSKSRRVVAIDRRACGAQIRNPISGQPNVRAICTSNQRMEETAMVDNNGATDHLKLEPWGDRFPGYTDWVLDQGAPIQRVKGSEQPLP